MSRASTDKDPACKVRVLTRSRLCHNRSMLLAYIDEIGEPGAFISHDHPKYNTSPAFGYAGFIIPAQHARTFGSRFTREKRIRFSKELSAAENPGRWEAKGSALFRPNTPTDRPENLRIFDSLIRENSNLSGHLFYYADEKPLGTPKQTSLNEVVRERDAMQETLNRIARHAKNLDQEVMVLIDSINEKTRVQRVAEMYSHIFSRAAEYPEMHAIVEPPMHLDSALSSNIQFADWVAAYVNRAIGRQLIEDSKYKWISRDSLNHTVRGNFTHESKLHFHNRSVRDLHHSEILKPFRPLYPRNDGLSVQQRVGAENMRRIKAAAERQHGGGNR